MIPPIRVGFSTTTALLSRIIRWFTKSTVSHAWILYYDVDFDCECVFEFSIGGGQIRTYEWFVKHNKIVKVWTPSVPINSGFVQARTLLDEGYDYKGLLGMIFVLLGSWLKHKWRNPWVSASKEFCSSAVAHVIKWAKIPGTESLVPDETSPQKLLDLAITDEGSHH